MCNKLWSLLFKERNVKSKRKYKYQNQDNIEQVSNVSKPKIDDFDIDELVKDANKCNLARHERVSKYDFREFEGRNDVTWEEVEDYLWIHCKYKGYEMWTEYCMYLVSKGIILKSDIQKIFDKHRKYISITPRPDLEAKEEKERDDDRWFHNKMQRYYDHDNKLANDEHWNYEHKDGTIHNIFRDLGCGQVVSEKETLSDNTLKTLFYDDYLKKKGYI